MRIGISSNALHCNTGYGIQARHLATRLTAAGHDVAVFAFYGVRGAVVNIGGIPHYPAGRLEYNADVIERHIAHWNCDVYLTLCDLGHQDPETIRRIRECGVQVLHWTPVDCHPLGILDRLVLGVGGGTPVAMSRYGQAELQAAKFDPLYAPHSVDTGIFAPAPPTIRAELREQERIDLRCADGTLRRRFAVAFTAMNKDMLRKGFYEGYEAFALFHAKHPDTILLLHSEFDGQFDHAHKIRELGIGDAVIATDDYLIKCGMLDGSYMAAWMNLADVGLMPSWGEGFGVPAIEYQACGLPVIATDCSALTELVQPGHGWRVAAEAKHQPLQKSAWKAPWITGLVQALESAHRSWRAADRKPWELRQAKCRKFAEKYDADTVFEQYWRPILARLEAGEFKSGGTGATSPAPVPVAEQTATEG